MCACVCEKHYLAAIACVCTLDCVYFDFHLTNRPDPEQEESSEKVTKKNMWANDDEMKIFSFSKKNASQLISLAYTKMKTFHLILLSFIFNHAHIGIHIHIIRHTHIRTHKFTRFYSLTLWQLHFRHIKNHYIDFFFCFRLNFSIFEKSKRK